MTDFDLRKLNPRSGDLVLLVDNDAETGESPLLLVFKRFLDKISDSRGIGITLLGENECHIEAEEAFYLGPQKSFWNYALHFPNPRDLRKSKIKYRADEGCLGLQNITTALKEMKGHISYADIMLAQS